MTLALTDVLPEQQSTRPRQATVAMCAAVVLVLIVGAWSRRWTSDDGFINLRIVQQILAGHGPVFNAGERVEAGTSTAWVGLLVVASRLFWFVRLEWVTVGLGLLTGAAACVMATVAAGRLTADRAQRVLVPAGLLVIVALPPTWDFTTSGLEVSLSFAWLAACFWALSRHVSSHQPAIWPAAVLAGLGPLVRPDLAIYSAAFLGALLVITFDGWRRAGMTLTLALAVPAVYELFRMAYYAALVPNTAFAKEAATARWGQGLYYLRDFIGPYWLWVPLLVFAALLTMQWSRWDRATRWIVAATVAGAVVHAAYIVRVGGDFMHARMLLPPLFALALPVAVVPIERVRFAALVLVPWAVLATHGHPSNYRDGMWGPHGTAIEREVYRHVAHVDHPVTIADYAHHWAWPQWGQVAKAADRGHQRVVFVREAGFVDPTPTSRPRLKPGLRHPVVVFANVGMLSYAAGADVSVVDLVGLGDPLASRVELTERYRPGHEKLLDPAWALARFVDPNVSFADPGLDAKVGAARDAIGCEPIRTVLDAVGRPLTLGRAMRNLKVSLTTYRTRWVNDPVLAAGTYCGS